MNNIIESCVRIMSKLSSFLPLLLIIILFSGYFTFYQPSTKKSVVVCVSQFADHPALNWIFEGIKKALDDAGYKNGDNLTLKHESAQGSIATAQLIAQRFVSLKPNCVVAIATPAAQSFVKYTEVPVVFAPITDPVSAKLVQSLSKPGGHMTGVSDLVAVEEQVAFILKIFPQVKNIGVVYNVGEMNSVHMVKKLTSYCKTININIVESIANKTNEVSMAAASLVGKVDVLLLPSDSTIATAIANLADVCNKQGLPVFVSDADHVAKGAFAGIGYDYKQLGYSTGKVVVQVLHGISPSKIPVVNKSSLTMWINLKTANILQVKIPKQILVKAKDLSKGK